MYRLSIGFVNTSPKETALGPNGVPASWMVGGSQPASCERSTGPVQWLAPPTPSIAPVLLMPLPERRAICVAGTVTPFCSCSCSFDHHRGGVAGHAEGVGIRDVDGPLDDDGSVGERRLWQRLRRDCEGAGAADAAVAVGTGQHQGPGQFLGQVEMIAVVGDGAGAADRQLAAGVDADGHQRRFQDEFAGEGVEIGQVAQGARVVVVERDPVEREFHGFAEEVGLQADA